MWTVRDIAYKIHLLCHPDGPVPRLADVKNSFFSAGREPGEPANRALRRGLAVFQALGGNAR
jgi:hypothetical protein